MSPVVPLATDKLFAKLGLGWGSSLLAGLSLACISIPCLVIRYGERIRKRDEVWIKNL
jgi:hypothetical protein